MTEFAVYLLGPMAMLAVGYGLGFCHGRMGWDWQLYVGIRRKQ